MRISVPNVTLSVPCYGTRARVITFLPVLLFIYLIYYYIKIDVHDLCLKSFLLSYLFLQSLTF